jgi:MFS family permease
MAVQSMRNILTRDFILGFFAQLVFAMAFFALIPTLPIYLSRLESKDTEIGVLIGIFSVSSLILRPFVGRSLLKISERHFMIAGALLFGATSLSLLFAPPFWPFLIVRVLQGVGYAFFSTASFTLIAHISPEAHRGQSVSYFFLGYNIALALGPLLGMFLINQFNFTVLFLFCLGLSLIALLATNKLRTRHAPPSRTSSAEDRFLFSRKALPPSVISFLFHFIWGALTTFFPLHAIRHGVQNPGLFFTIIAIMLILGRTIGGRMLDLYSRERVLLPCLVAFIISMVILVFSTTLPLFMIVAVIWGIGHAFFYPSLVVYVFDRAGSSPGPAMGTFTAMSDLGMFLGPVVMGVVLHLAGYSTMFFSLFLIAAIQLVYFYFFMGRKGGLPANR